MSCAHQITAGPTAESACCGRPAKYIVFLLPGGFDFEVCDAHRVHWRALGYETTPILQWENR